MKLLISLLLLSTLATQAQKSVYSISIPSAAGQTIDLSDYEGKKMLIAAISQENLSNKNAFVFWDSLEKAYPNVNMIIVPANDIGTDSATTLKSSVISASPSKIGLGSPSKVKKDKGANQNRLMQWLTNASENLHFDLDVTTDYQLYVISESGILYAVMEKGVSAKVIDEILKQEDVAKLMRQL